MTTGTVLPPVIRALRGIAPLIGDLVAQVGGLRSRPQDGGRTGKADEAPLPLNAVAFDDASALFMHLANEVIYTAAWLEQDVPIIDAWRAENGAIIGLRAHWTPRQAHVAAQALTVWLEAHLPELPEHALDGLLFEVRSIAKRHPFRDRSTTSTTAVCPDCNGALLVTPPRHHGDGQLVTCRACGLQLDEAEYARTEHRYAGILAAEKRKARATAVRDRLARKYLGTTTHVVA